MHLPTKDTHGYINVLSKCHIMTLQRARSLMEVIFLSHLTSHPGPLWTPCKRYGYSANPPTLKTRVWKFPKSNIHRSAVKMWGKCV